MFNSQYIRKVKGLSMFIWMLIMTSSLSAQVKFVNEFLNIGVGARAHGMFGSVVANVDDASAAYWNTAGLTGIESPLQVSAMHASWFGGIANYDYLSIAKRLNNESRSVGGISIIRMGIDNIPNTLNLIAPDGSVDYSRVTNFSAADYAFLLSYARAMNESQNFSLGGSLKIIKRNIGDFGGAWGFGADLGMMWKKDRYSIGVSARDITTTFNSWTFNLSESDKDVFAQTGNEIPVSSTELSYPRIVLGGAYFGNFSQNISYLAEMDINVSTNGTKSGILSGKNIAVDPTIGVEVGYRKKVFLRAGIGNIQRVINEVNADKESLWAQPNVGMGLALGRLKVDYALTNIGSVSGVLVSHIFSLTIDFKARSSSRREINIRKGE